MRPIKFRAWFVPTDWETEKQKNGRMVYFNEIGYCDEYNHLKFQLAQESTNEDGGSYSNLSAEFEDFKHVMQFTGLHDKNGKEIYEGDIVLCDDGGEYFSQEYDEEKDEYYPIFKAKVIGPTETYPAFEIDPNPCDDCNGLSQAMATGTLEVIGNIHENPELLK